MTREKDINARTAEALGCKLDWVESNPFSKLADPDAGYWDCGCDVREHGFLCYGIHDYAHSWAITGPLIEKYGITSTPVEAWADDFRSVGGNTRLEAVCNLLLALKEAGKL